MRPEESIERLTYGDVAVGRIDVRRSLDGVQAGLVALLELTHRGVRVLNRPAALLRAHDKLRTAQLLAAYGVPQPRFGHVTATRTPGLRPPVVIKPRFGSWGVEVMRCDSEEALDATLRGLADRPWFHRQGALIQSLVPPVGHDLRVLVAGGRVVGGQRRVAAAGEWRTNVSLGGARVPVDIPARAKVLALGAAMAISGDLLGIDLLPDGDEFVVIEVNGAVDFQESYALPGTSVFAEIAAALEVLPPDAAQWMPDADLAPAALTP